MGWTSKRYRDAEHDTFDQSKLVDFLQYEFYGDYEFAKIHFEHRLRATRQNHVCYAIARNIRTNTLFIMVLLINIDAGEIAWKELSEREGPTEDRCPVQFFKWVPDPGGYATEWRAKCIKNNVQHKSIKF